MGKYSKDTLQTCWWTSKSWAIDETVADTVKRWFRTSFQSLCITTADDSDSFSFWKFRWKAPPQTCSVDCNRSYAAFRKHFLSVWKKSWHNVLIDSRILQKKQVFEAIENKSRWLFLQNNLVLKKNVESVRRNLYEL